MHHATYHFSRLRNLSGVFSCRSIDFPYCVVSESIAWGPLPDAHDRHAAMLPCRPAAWGEAGVLDSRYTPSNYVRKVLHVQVKYQYALPARFLAFSIIVPPVPVPGVVCSKGLGCSW